MGAIEHISYLGDSEKARLGKKHSEKHARAVSRSKLWFKGFDEERIKDRKDPFATKVFQTSLWEHRTRVTLEDF